MTEVVESKWISGFWRRIGALIIDTLILGIIGFVLGLFLKSTFVELGGWGRLIGFFITLLYFGVMNSSISDGQTIGKGILDLRVVDSNNTPISLVRSVLRYLPLAIVFSLNGARFPNETMDLFWVYPLSIVIIGGVSSILYLYIFNRVTRQSLHDLAAGTFVVNANAEKQEIGKVWNIHIMVVAVLLIVAATIPIFTTKLAQSESFSNTVSLLSILSNEENVSYATISVGAFTTSSAKTGTRTRTYVKSQVFLETDNIGDVELARKLASVIVANYPASLEKDSIDIILIYGYDIGISASWTKHGHRFNPKEF